MAFSSTHAVFEIPEIREMILLKVDMRTLLCMQRTCRSWLRTIKESLAIQKALFFTPIENTPDQEKAQNLLLAEAFPPLFQVINPLIPEDAFGYVYDNTFTTFDMLKDPSIGAAYLRPEASWRRMLVQQPPVRDFAVIMNTTGGYGYNHEYFKVPEDPRGFTDGLRMGDFFEALMFDDDLDYAIFRLKRVTWWKRTSQHGLSVLNQMGQLMGKTVDSDIVLTLRAHPGGSHDSEDQKIRDAIRAAYQVLGIQPRLFGKADQWSHFPW
ncbi:hypothetical protein Asppvi_001682 [Aspergillus pseudoviridinutans]|uniref:F-box domain-containing protein n=1 Tax=Aspergillus pseudoviridinutans TaxID=1517512 RepID=A0A9P3B781_9EURO|nr:uncharacterized protein Asppvi_001682 [Aspergillus pseudoviridinutans]GIJ83163.1 hypothetical protein Asppvi_001682 [Aspergillus pseudoviridinutans]